MMWMCSFLSFAWKNKTEKKNNNNKVDCHLKKLQLLLRWNLYPAHLLNGHPHVFVEVLNNNYNYNYNKIRTKSSIP